jgi:hypothetical protein
MKSGKRPSHHFHHRGRCSTVASSNLCSIRPYDFEQEFEHRAKSVNDGCRFVFQTRPRSIVAEIYAALAGRP